MGTASSKAQAAKAKKTVRAYMKGIAKEVKKLRVRQEAHGEELRTIKRDGIGKLVTVHGWGALRMVPMFEERAVLAVRKTLAMHALDRACTQALNGRLTECRALLDSIEAHSLKFSGGGTTPPPSPLEGITDDFYATPLTIISGDPVTQTVRREVKRLTQQAADLDARIQNLKHRLEPLTGEEARRQLLVMLDTEHEEVAAAAEAEASGKPVRRAADAAPPWMDRQVDFNSIVTDQRSKLGRLLQRWCARVLGVPGRKYTFGVDLDLDSVTVPGIPAELLTAGVRQPDFDGATNKPPATPTLSPMAGAPLVPATGAGGAAADAAAGVAMVPTPNVILAFLGYFTKEMLRTFDIEATHTAMLRRYVDRLVYPRIHSLCFEQLHGHDVLVRRDARWLSRVRVARGMTARAIGVRPEFLRPLPSQEAAVPAPLRATTATPPEPAERPPPAVSASAPDGELFVAAASRLGRMEQETIPSLMLGHLVAAMELAFTELGERCGDSGAGAKLDAEGMMPVFVFLVSRSGLQRPHACMAYLANFGISPNNMGGRAAYLVTTAQAAVSWVCRLRAPRVRRPRPIHRAISEAMSDIDVGSPHTARSSMSSRGRGRFSDEESDGDDSYFYEGDGTRETSPPPSTPPPTTPGGRPTPQSVQFDAAIGALLRHRSFMVPNVLDGEGDGDDFEDSMDADVSRAEEELDDYMREEGMPEETTRAMDAKRVEELSVWLGHVALIEETLELLG